MSAGDRAHHVLLGEREYDRAARSALRRHSRSGLNDSEIRRTALLWQRRTRISLPLNPGYSMKDALV